MRIDQGLFKQEFADHHAVLGVPIESDMKDTRKRYLRIARRLHPDSLGAASDAEKQKASELLSKLVNPAYKVLSQEKSAAEHGLMLQLKGQQLSKNPDQVELMSDAAKSLMVSSNPELTYSEAVRDLASSQYDSLEQITEVIGQLSELNLVFIMRRGGADAAETKPAVTTAQPTPTTATASAAADNPPVSPRRNRDLIISSYLERARMFEREQNFNQAMLELREVIKTYPNSADCHGQLAAVYIKLGQQTMARVHAKRALDIDPDNELAQKVQKSLQHKQNAAPRDKSAQGAKSRSGFFGLFGGKNK